MISQLVRNYLQLWNLKVHWRLHKNTIAPILIQRKPHCVVLECDAVWFGRQILFWRDLVSSSSFNTMKTSILIKSCHHRSRKLFNIFQFCSRTLTQLRLYGAKRLIFNQDVEGSCCDLICSTATTFDWRDQGKPQKTTIWLAGP